MDRDLEESMLAYYDERASEYDQVYAGELPAAPEQRPHYSTDAAALLEIVAERCHGQILDAPCGTAFWLPAYAAHAESVALVDQSPRMLDQALAKARAVGIEPSCTLLRANILRDPWEHAGFDTLLCGFFLSHVEGADEKAFLARARSALRPGGQLLVLDSRWSDPRRRTRPRAGRARRQLNDGRQFDIYKRYFDSDEVGRLADQLGGRAEILYEGEVFLAFALRPS